MSLRVRDSLPLEIAIAVMLTLGLLSGCASVPTDYPRTASFAYTDTGDTNLGVQVRENFAGQLQQTGVFALHSGMQAFVARMGLIAAAERSLDLQYYIWHADSSGKLLANQLLQAADRGMRVRLLLDVLAVGPLVADVSNMFDLYWNSEMVVPVAAFTGAHDLTGEALRDAQARFEASIDEELASPYIRAIQESEILDELILSRMTFKWGSAQLIYDDPRKMDHEEISGATHLAPQLAPLFANARTEVQVVSPYFVPGDELVAYFAALEARGTRVRILTNSLAANDVGMVHAGYMRYRKDLLRAGVDLYEFKPDPAQLSARKSWSGSSSSSLHTKFMGADGELVFVGSFNLDPRSVALNTEMGVLFENPELDQQMLGAFNEAVVNRAYQVQLDAAGDLVWLERDSGQTIRYHKEPHTTAWQRFVVRFLSWIVPESML